MILDTNFLGALDDGDAGAQSLAERIESDDTPARIPTPVVFEIHRGIDGADDSEAMRVRYEQLLAGKPRVELSVTAARRGGRLYSRHRRSDRKERLDLVDAMVAGVALDHEEPVVTNDTAFGDVSGLSVRTY
ncbi:MAG: PIN domain-containing protein [Halobaculum sp.]